MDERESVARLKRGEIGGLEPLVRSYQAAAVKTAWLITCDRGMAEDVVQAAFIKAYERIAQFDAERPFGAWFLRIVANDARKAATRARRIYPLEPHDGAEGDARADDSPGPEELLAQAETRAEVWRALEGLTPDQRAAVVLRYYVGLSQAEVAERLGVPPGTAKRRLHDARGRLRNVFGGERPVRVDGATPERRGPTGLEPGPARQAPEGED